jgi:hypothetical protein
MGVLKDILAAITGAKDTIASLDQRVAKLTRERAEIEARGPHRDDLIGWVMRGIDQAEKEFFRVLRHNWNETELARHPGSTIGEDSGPQLLAMGIGTADAPNLWLSRFGNGDHRYFTHGASVTPLIFFMRPLLEARAAELVDRCYPNASNGLKHADRMKRLAAIDAAIDAALKERDELREQLASAAKHADDAKPRPHIVDGGATLERMATSDDPDVRAAAHRAAHR